MDGFNGTEGSSDTYGPSHVAFDGAVDGDGQDDLDGTLDYKVNLISDGHDDLDGALDCEGEPEKDGFDDTKGALDTDGPSDATFDGAADTAGRDDLE